MNKYILIGVLLVVLFSLGCENKEERRRQMEAKAEEDREWVRENTPLMKKKLKQIQELLNKEVDLAAINSDQNYSYEQPVKVVDKMILHFPVVENRSGKYVLKDNPTNIERYLLGLENNNVGGSILRSEKDVMYNFLDLDMIFVEEKILDEAPSSIDSKNFESGLALFSVVCYDLDKMEAFYRYEFFAQSSDEVSAPASKVQAYLKIDLNKQIAKSSNEALDLHFPNNAKLGGIRRTN